MAGNEGAWVRDLAKETGTSEPLMRMTLARMARRGDLHQVIRDLYYSPATITKLGRLCRDLAASSRGDDSRPEQRAPEGSRAPDGSGAPDGSITAACFRDATGLGRKRAIQILEYFDRIGLLRRHGDVHRLRTDSRLFEQETMKG